ncbi:MAG: hypothetical protein QNJ98_01125 [Planctomycetota bacterium]|nr:hypothetical protein [Planctomycetota bacterium]
MFAFVHRSGLTDDDSGAWLRYVLRALARLGHTVHAVCGEHRPERFDFVSEAYAYEPDGSVLTRLHRQTVHPGRIVLHTPLTRDRDAPLSLDALFDALAAVVPGHGIEVLSALGGGVAGAAAHRAHAAWGTPFTVIRRGGGRGDPAVLAGATCVFDRRGEGSPVSGMRLLARGVDATAVHPLRRSARAEQIGRLCERLRDHEADDQTREALAVIESIDWMEARVIVPRIEDASHMELLEGAVAELDRSATGEPIAIAGPLPASLYPEWLPCIDVFVAFEEESAARRPGVLDAMAAGVVPVATLEAGAGAVSAALAEGGDARAASTLVVPHSLDLGIEPLIAALALALEKGPELKGPLRQATVQRHDWHVVAADLIAALEEVVDLGRSARAAG